MYESELYDLFTNKIMKIYNIETEDKAYKYLRLRFLIYNLDKDVKEFDNLINFSKFLISELNIPTESGFIYKETKINLLDILYNIMENWKFRASLVNEVNIWNETTISEHLQVDDFIQKAYINIKRTSSAKAKRITKNKTDIIVLTKYIGLKKLSELFNAETNIPNKIEGVYYGPNYNPFKRTIEEELDSFIHCINIQNGLNLINEYDLENYMINNLELLEGGLKYVDRQVVIPGGRIDILARDIDNNYVIIELKVEEDKEIIWQSMYYPEAIKEKYKTNKVRILTLCPEYKPHIYKALRSLDLDMYIYRLNLNFRKIENIKVWQCN